jgi:hypothetical protein
VGIRRTSASLRVTGAAVSAALLSTLLSAIAEVSSASECAEADPPKPAIALFFAVPVVALAGLVAAVIERRRERRRDAVLAVVAGTATLLWAGGFFVYLLGEAFECFTF